MKKIKIMTLLVCAVIFVFGININCDSIIENSSTYAKLQIKKTTGVKMPKEANMLYQYNVKYFQDGTIRYYVFEFSSEPTEWLRNYEFSNIKDKNFESSFFDYNNWKNFKIPEEYLPREGEQYSWLRLSSYFFYYTPDNLRVIVYLSSYRY